MAEYETHQVQLPRTLSRRVVRQLLVERAEYGGWELARVRIYPDGRRVVTLRRRIIRATKTFPTGAAAPV
ncbi:DUF5703 family protein [Actinopolymorpha alba]|uniref:DUF5703 family protein n=1 Tax=Actinopolymorpha alba TaxID=533267 RepID=UPI000371EEBE|nr:DUF5703 family protein [Actinopolymorpha alba]